MQEKQEIEVCPECGNKAFIKDGERAELICANCGLVLSDKLIDPGPEWRAFDQEQKDKRSRTGAPTTFTIHDKGLSTVIDWRDKDSFGKLLAPKRRAQIHRLRKWQKRIRVSSASERNLAFALSELDRMTSQLNLPRDIREASALIYRKAVECQLVRGRSIDSIAAAALYAACRRCRIPRTLTEIAMVARANRKEIARSYRFIAQALVVKVPPANPSDYIPKLIAKLGLNGEVQRKAIEIVTVASRNGMVSGRGPVGIAAAAVYIASVLLNHKKTQRDVASTAGVTEVTVRNRYKELVDKLNLIVKLT